MAARRHLANQLLSFEVVAADGADIFEHAFVRAQKLDVVELIVPKRHSVIAGFFVNSAVDTADFIFVVEDSVQQLIIVLLVVKSLDEETTPCLLALYSLSV